jgi:hypothetical protein
MKKIIVAILAILYMGMSSGIAMDIHYCMGKETGVDFYSKGTEDSKCDKCGMKHMKGCCGETHKFYKLTNSHKSVSNDINFGTTIVAILTTFPLSGYYLPITIAAQTANNYSPPDYARPSYCIMNSVFRI